MVVNKGSFSLDFGLFKMQAEINEDDRQCAWELYAEIVTRVAVCGKVKDVNCEDFSGEVLAESLSSLHSFFKELRGIMRRFPVGKLKPHKNHHLGILINDVIVNVLRPFLEKWQAEYRHWWETESDQSLPPFERQKQYPQYEEFMQDWCNLRLLMCELRQRLVKKYQLVDVTDARRLLQDTKNRN